MKHILAVLLLLTLAAPALGQDVDKGVQTYQLGDCSTDLLDHLPAAEHGDAPAQYCLAEVYARGQGVKRDLVEAVKWYRRSAEQGFADAQFMLAVFFPLVVKPQDYAESVKWLRKAAEQGHSQAQGSLGYMYARGQGVAQDYAEAVNWHRKAAGQGNVYSQHELGDLYINGQGVPQDYVEAVKWYRKAAEQGYAAAQVKLGLMYYAGQDVPQDYARAMKWYRNAAEQGHAGAQAGLGNMYSNGLGVEQDFAQAVKWYRKAAEQGFAFAQSRLGQMYAGGHSIPQDYAEAMKWFRKAAEQGYTTAQYYLGQMYHGGHGVPQDYAEAMKWYRKAAEQGHAGAQLTLGSMYTKSQGVPQDNAEAVRWFRKSAEQGNAKAQYNLSAMYGNGQGVPQDYVQEHMWINLAVSRSPPGEFRDKAAAVRDGLAAEMTQAQITEAQKLAREWNLRHSRNKMTQAQITEAMLFPVALKAEKGGEPITIDQITKELINSWWDSPKTYTSARTQCEEVKHVVEVHPAVGEKAFLAVCRVNRSHAEGFTTSLIVRPRYKEAREFINVGDGSYSIDQPKVVDIEHDGVSELVIGTGQMNMGIYQGNILVVRVQGWQSRELFEERIVNCSGNGFAAYIRYENCSFGSSASVVLEFEDLDGDGLLDLIETVNHYEGFDEVSMEEAIRLVDCWDGTNDFKSCWRNEKPATPVRDSWEIELKVGKTVNRYLFKNGGFVPLQGQ